MMIRLVEDEDSLDITVSAPVAASSHVKTSSGTYRASFLADNGLKIETEEDGRVVAIPKAERSKRLVSDQPAKVVPETGFNVVLTHATADFDSLASAVGLAKLWSAEEESLVVPNRMHGNKTFDSASHVPTFVVLPRGAHPGVQKFLGLHKHLFPIRSLKSLPGDLSGLNRLALVDAQRRDRLGPADSLLQYANRITVVDHHIDQDSDIAATDYVVDKVGSVSTIIVELLQNAKVEISEVEATLFALGIHADTGSLSFDSTTARDAYALAWCLAQGASQAAISENAKTSLSSEQQSVLTQALVNTNSTVVHGVTISTVLLSADGFINGLAAVTQDALELSSSDIFILGVVYEAQSGGKRRRGKSKGVKTHLLTSRLLKRAKEGSEAEMDPSVTWIAKSEGGEEALRRKRLKAVFDRGDLDGSGYLETDEVASALASSGVIASEEAISELISEIDTDGDGRIDFEEFLNFTIAAEALQEAHRSKTGGKATTMILIGRVKAAVTLKAVKLNNLFERFGGGGHAKAASATLRLDSELEAADVLQGLVDELIETSLQEQVTVSDFMTSPVLSVNPSMNEKQIEDLFSRHDVRAFPVVDEENNVIGLVTYKEVAAAKQRLWNKQQKQLKRDRALAVKGELKVEDEKKRGNMRKYGSNVKGWMLQHVQTVEASMTMSEVETILLENDIGCLPVVLDGTKQLVGMVTRTDLLRQHRYYSSLHYNNKAFANSIADRKNLAALRKKLKKFDLD